MIKVSDFSHKKVVEYLKPGMKALICFHHGLGDTIMFIPLYYKLKSLYTNVHFDLHVDFGQEEIFQAVNHDHIEDYDIVFDLAFPMSEGSGVTKPALCATSELGIEPITAVAVLPWKPSPIVAVHFNGTALPDSVGCPEPVAKQIWQEIKEAGKVPLECHFEHCFHNPVNKKFDFIDSTVRGCTANLHNLIGLLQHSFAFIGVASGPLVAAISIMPKRTLYLEKYHKLECYTTLSISKANVLDYRAGSIKEWLGGLG